MREMFDRNTSIPSADFKARANWRVAGAPYLPLTWQQLAGACGDYVKGRDLQKISAAHHCPCLTRLEDTTRRPRKLDVTNRTCARAASPLAHHESDQLGEPPLKASRRAFFHHR